MDVSPECLYVEARRGNGNGVTDCCQLPHGWYIRNLGPSLQPHIPFLCCVGVEPRAPCMPGKCPTTDHTSSLPFFLICRDNIIVMEQEFHSVFYVGLELVAILLSQSPKVPELYIVLG